MVRAVFCMETPVAVKQTASVQETKMNLHTGAFMRRCVQQIDPAAEGQGNCMQHWMLVLHCSRQPMICHSREDSAVYGTMARHDPAP